MKAKTVFGLLAVAGVAAIGYYLYKKNNSENKSNATGGSNKKKTQEIPPKPSTPCGTGWVLRWSTTTGKPYWACYGGLGDIQN
jgi:hypothetical protein